MSNLVEELTNIVRRGREENLSDEQILREVEAFCEGYRRSSLPEQVVHEDQRFSLWSFIKLILECVAHIMMKLFEIFMIGFVFAAVSVITILLTPKLTPKPNREDHVLNSHVKFADVKGAHEAKHELKLVVEFLKNPERFSNLGAKLPKGVLLVGPPGTGKTLLARSVAGEAEVPFFPRSGAEFEEIFVGMGARKIRDLFKAAEEVAPSVIFIDEIDSVGRKRTSSPNHPHANDVINQLLSEMDGFSNRRGIIVLAATNRKEDLDDALLRPGRFDVVVRVELPDLSERRELFEFYLAKVRGKNISVDQLARGTTGFSGAQIESLVNQAALEASLSGAEYVTMEHLELATDKMLLGPAKVNKITDVHSNLITAVHEAGHAVVSHFTPQSLPLYKVTILPRGSTLGHTAHLPDKERFHMTKAEMQARLDVLLGGRAAEENYFGASNITSGAASDLQAATELATDMVVRWGMSENLGLVTYPRFKLTDPDNPIDKEVSRAMQESYRRAKQILDLHSGGYQKILMQLMLKDTLKGEEVEAILNAASGKVYTVSGAEAYGWFLLMEMWVYILFHEKDYFTN